MSENFWNEPHVDWNKESIAAMEEGLKRARKSFGRYCPVMIDGKAMRESQELIYSFDPAYQGRVVGIAGVADAAEVEFAAEVALRAFNSWKNRKIESIADILQKVGNIFRERKFELAPLIVFEVSKSWDEAVSEVEEAIDFIELYRESMIKFSEPVIHQPWIRSEKNYSYFIPRGITGVVKGWNFPVALPVESIVASLAAGSPALFKPAEQSPVCGMEVVRYFLDAGVPAGLIAYLPGFADTGKAIVASPLVTQITFTGSREVGMQIYETAAKNPSRFGPKRVDLELGGNNLMIVGESAIHDKVVKDIIISRFGYNGQKCSALQRLIIINQQGNEAKWVERLDEAVLSLQIGHPEDPIYRYSALIDEAARDKYLAKMKASIKIASKSVVHASGCDGNGYFVSPAIFTGIPHESKLTQEEVFGPMLFVFNVKNIEDAVKLANSTDFALTAGIHTELGSEKDYFVKHCESGNKYVNRPITGSHPGRQPFGGHKFSGFGEKVGTPERLKFFMNSESVSVNLESRGTVFEN
ncbi:MAG: aldehyde dehydrogenase family protein [Candidatus Liptonbacteria bacterium]|nr:aldehyde dehydrogenase family protein [Candidatus Liptonbacteria bacterium]